MEDVVFIGTGDATDPALPNTSVLISGAQKLLVDCGYSVPHALWAYSTDPDLLDAIYLTHLHADHSFGLPAILLSMRFGGRRRPLRLLGGPGATAGLRALLDLGYPGAFEAPKCFPIEIEELRPGAPYRLQGMVLSCAQSAHSLPNFALRVEEGELSVGCSGDGAPTLATEELYRGVGLLIHESYRREGELNGHATAAQVLELSGRTASELALVHCAVEERAEFEGWLQRQNAPLPTFIPRPGQVWRPGKRLAPQQRDP